MAHHGSSFILCLLAFILTLAYAQVASDPFIQPLHRHRHRHHQHKHHEQQHHHQHKTKQHGPSLETKRGTAAGNSATPKPFSLDWFIAGKIAEAVKEVEATDFSYLKSRAAGGAGTGTERRVVGETAAEDVAGGGGPDYPQSGHQAQPDDTEARSETQTGGAQKGATQTTNRDDRGEEGVAPFQRVAAQSNSERQQDNAGEPPPEGLVTSTKGSVTSGTITREEDDDGPPPREDERAQSRQKLEPHDSLPKNEGETVGENERRQKNESTKRTTEAVPSSTSNPGTETNSTDKPSRPQSLLPEDDDTSSRQTEEPTQGNHGKQFRGQDKGDKAQTGQKGDRQREQGSKQTSERAAYRKRTRPALSKQRAEDHWNREEPIRPPKKGCPGCSKRGLSIARAREHHKQVLRNQVLDKLRLVPSFTKLPWPPKLPGEVFPDPPQRDHEDYNDQYYAKPDRLLVFGRDLGRLHRLRKSGTGSYQFAVTGKVKGRVTSAHLWVYKMKDAHDVHGQTLVITDLRFSKRNRVRERSLVARADTHVKEGWVRFDVTRLVHRWLKEKTPPAAQMLAVRCKTCHRTEYRAIFGAKSNFRPVLVMEERADVTRGSRRERRDTCDPSVRCCKFDMTVQFRDLGIYEIFHPRTLKVDYCHGTCDRPDAFHYNHTVIIQRQRFASYEPVNKTMFDRLRPCCVPVVLREASLMHYINDGLDTQVSRVPNLLVERCGCA